MLSVAVHKDISEYQEKIVGKLSARTLACVVLGLGVSVAVAVALNLAAGVAPSDASLPVVVCSVPFWLMGFWRPCGMPPERFVPLWARWVLSEEAMTYRPPILPGSPGSGRRGRTYAKRMRRKGAEARGYEEASRGSRRARRGQGIG